MAVLFHQCLHIEVAAVAEEVGMVVGAVPVEVTLKAAVGAVLPGPIPIRPKCLTFGIIKANGEAMVG
jgi:hypothetical protein